MISKCGCASVCLQHGGLGCASRWSDSAEDKVQGLSLSRWGTQCRSHGTPRAWCGGLLWGRPKRRGYLDGYIHKKFWGCRRLHCRVKGEERRPYLIQMNTTGKTTQLLHPWLCDKKFKFEFSKLVFNAVSSCLNVEKFWFLISFVKHVNIILNICFSNTGVNFVWIAIRFGLRVGMILNHVPFSTGLSLILICLLFEVWT